MNKQELTDKYVKYLTEEGYNPELDAGNVKFKKEGGLYVIVIVENDPTYFWLMYPNFHQFKTREERVRIFEACNLAMLRTKAGKLLVADDYVWASCETYLPDADSFRVVFNRAIASIQLAVETFNAELSKSQQTVEAASAVEAARPVRSA
jgi:hypothetical protein